MSAVQKAAKRAFSWVEKTATVLVDMLAVEWV
jgi:hypothetical protein